MSGAGPGSVTPEAVRPGAAVKVNHLSVAFGADGAGRALEGIDLRVAPGEMIGLVGANGAGKSTLLRTLVGMVPPPAGTVQVDGLDVGSAGKRALRRLRGRTGMIFQRFCLAGRLSAFQNVLHGAMGRTGPRGWLALTASEEERLEAMACLDRVGLAHLAERRAARLSGGEAQRVAIARALMQRPALLLADEPVASLDPAATLSVMELLSAVAREQRVTTVVALHQLDLARRYSDRLIGLRGGRLDLDRAATGCGDGELDALYHSEVAA